MLVTLCALLRPVRPSTTLFPWSVLDSLLWRSTNCFLCLLVAGTTPRTVNDEWQAARAKMDLSKERVAGEPVEVNPIRHAAKQKL